ncbi:uncharacterized protein LOC144582184 isoform X2 [Callithrix jacchus]
MSLACTTCGIWFISNLSEDVRGGFDFLCLGPVHKKSAVMSLIQLLIHTSRSFYSKKLPSCYLLQDETPGNHHSIICFCEFEYFRCIMDMDESGNHHSQQTDTRTENPTSHVLTHRRVLNNENTWTTGVEHHTLGSVGGE